MVSDRILWSSEGYNALYLSAPTTKPVLSLAAPLATVVEGFTSPQSFSATVTLSAASTLPVTVRYETYRDDEADNPASVGTDYQAVSGVLNFPAGTTTQTISIPILDDSFVESQESIQLRLLDPTNSLLVPEQSKLDITISEIGRAHV